MLQAFVTFDTITELNWLEVIRTVASIATVGIAYSALRNWQRQDKAKREAEFLDALIETTHSYIVEMPKLFMLLETAKMGMDSHTPNWESDEKMEQAVKGAIAYIEKHGEQDAKGLVAVLEAAQPSVIKLRSLAAKGQMFNFQGYAECQEAIERLTRQFDRIEAFTSFIGASRRNWEHPEILKLLKGIMAIEPDEIRKSVQEDNVKVLRFTRETYAQIYGRTRNR